MFAAKLLADIHKWTYQRTKLTYAASVIGWRGGRTLKNLRPIHCDIPFVPVCCGRACRFFRHRRCSAIPALLWRSGITYIGVRQICGERPMFLKNKSPAELWNTDKAQKNPARLISDLLVCFICFVGNCRCSIIQFLSYLYRLDCKIYATKNQMKN